MLSKKQVGVTLLFGMMMSLTFQEAAAKKIKVTSVAELQSAIKTSGKGDTIVMANNTYTDAGIIGVDGSGMTILAETNGKVIFTGMSGFKIAGSNNTLAGFQFKDGDIGKEKGEIIEVMGNYNLLTQLNFINFISHNYVHFDEGSHHNELSYSNLEAKPATKNAGPSIQITTSESVVNHTWIHHCTFMNFKGDGGDFGNEPIRIGLGKEQLNVSGAVVEFCYFENLGLGDSETISIKSTCNVIRYNTFRNNPMGQLTFRTGNKNSAYGNFFINSGGIRIKEGQDHSVYNNYFEGPGDPVYPPLKLMNFVLNKKSNIGLPLDRIHIFNNTFYNYGDIDLGGAGNTPPDHVYFTNNIFVKKSGNIVTNYNDKVQFLNNIYFGGAAMGMSLEEKQMKSIDPQLKLNTSGFYGVTEKSPAIDASKDPEVAAFDNPEVDDDASLKMDIEGQKRTSKKDIGCDEFSKDKTSNHPLIRTDVGPLYLSN